jgi:hypothetical protein
MADVIYLPDQSQPVEKTRSGSEKRRRHLERFRTDDTEHAALHAKVRASGKSLGAYVMQLAAIDATQEARARRRSRPTVDALALKEAMTGFNRENSNYNQAVKALNTLALVAQERSSRELAEAVNATCNRIDRLQQGFEPSFAAILAALAHVRELFDARGFECFGPNLMAAATKMQAWADCTTAQKSAERLCLLTGHRPAAYSQTSSRPHCQRNQRRHLPAPVAVAGGFPASRVTDNSAPNIPEPHEP